MTDDLSSRILRGKFSVTMGVQGAKRLTNDNALGTPVVRRMYGAKVFFTRSILSRSAPCEH